MKYLLAVSCVVLTTYQHAFVTAQNDDTHFLDRFTYEDEDVVRADGFIDYAPQDWIEIRCNEEDDLEECLGYRDKWETGRGWQIERNYCVWCPVGAEQCDKNHQSPINLKREVGLDPATNPQANECIDIHWMKYEDSTCNMQDLIDHDGFTIERHGLRIAQPITVFENFANDTDGLLDGVRLDCRKPGKGNVLGRVDFSKGYSNWWHLSHIDVHVPSEHTQEGKRYDAEIQLYHFYSVTAAEANGTANQMGTISIFMEAYENVAPYKYLDKVICQWRRKEYETRLQCGLEPIESTYPGCFPLNRDRDLKEERRTGMRGAPESDTSKSDPFRPNANEVETSERLQSRYKFQTFADVIYHNDFYRDDPIAHRVNIEMEEANWGPPENKDWDVWILEQSKKMKEDEELYHKLKNNHYGGEHSDDLHETYRRLIQGDDMEWFNYWPMVGVRTEYYYRYSGSQTIPPCYGPFVEDSRAGTNHWRVMKDPIRIHPRQLAELKRLVAERIAPRDDPVSPCQPDTAAKVTRDDDTNEIIDVWAARPLMNWSFVHFTTFCECKDWESKWPEDRAWCILNPTDINERFYTHPYNFDEDGF